MKFAITGKGGTGKTTVAGLLAHYFNRDGFKVLAVDSDPDANLASAIGLPFDEASGITPVSKQRRLIQERTGAKPNQFGQLFKINPTVDDIPDKFCIDFRGIRLLVMGAVQKGGTGCACPENVLLRSLLTEIILNRNEVIIVDMEAGIEHLGRSTSQSVDKMVIVVEPGSRSVLTAKSIMKLAQEIGIYSFGIVGNKIQGEEQMGWIEKQFDQRIILGMISYHDIFLESDIKKQPLIDLLDERLKTEFEAIYRNIGVS
jgi:CO dehydrogenase maturation factor